MESKKYISYIAAFIFFVSMSLSYCVLPFKIGGKSITYALVFELAFLGIILLINYKQLLTKITEFYKNKEIIMIVLFLFSVFFLGLITMFFGGQSGILRILLATLFKVFIFMIPLFFGYYVTRVLKNEKVIKILYLTIFIILCYGLLDFCIFKFHLSFLEPVFRFFINSHDIIAGGTTAKTVAIPRVQSFFAEPSFFAYFLVLFLPFIYTLSSRRYRIFKNYFINTTIKKLLLFLAIFELFATQAPIFILIGVIVSVVYFFLKSRRKKTIIIYFVTVLLLIILLFSSIEVVESLPILGSVVRRIIKAVQAFSSIEQLAISEPSLATRVISYLNMWDIFIKSPILGCGCGNLPYAMYTQFTTSSYPLTREIIVSLYTQTTMNCNIFFQTLAESGFIAIIFLYSAFCLTLKRIKKYIKYTNIWNKQILQAFFMYIVIFVVLSFYSSEIHVPYIWVMLGIILGYCNNLKYQMLNIKRGYQYADTVYCKK